MCYNDIKLQIMQKVRMPGMTEIGVAKGAGKIVLENFDGVKRVFKTLWDRAQIDLGTAFETYLENAYEKYAETKTLLYRNERKKIRDFLVTPRLEREASGEQIVAKTISDVTRSDQFILIQGAGGIGKSILMKHLFLSAVEEQKLIPIFFELRHINDLPAEYDLTEVLFAELDILGEARTKKALEYALSEGMFVFILDGYDEISGDKATDFVKRLNTYCDAFSGNHFIISTRPISASDFVEFKRFSVFSTCELEKEQAIELIDKLDDDFTVKRRFKDALEKKLYDKHTSFASNPLLLTMMFLTYDDCGEVPEKLHIFYEKTFETLLYRHDASKDGYKRELKSGLSSDAFKTVFSHFCCKTYYHGILEMSHDELISILKKSQATLASSGIAFDPEKYAADLIDAVCMLYDEGSSYRFVHRSFQEYFTAWFLKEQVDEDMQKIGLGIITKDFMKAVEDDTFPMLYAMARKKFEKNIFLPLLRACESNYESGDKYNYHLKALSQSIAVWLTDTEYIETGIGMVLGEVLPWGAYQLARLYHNKEESSCEYDAELRLQEYLEAKIDRRFSCEDFLNDAEAYCLLKDTRIGRRVVILSEMREELEEKFARGAADDFF